MFLLWMGWAVFASPRPEAAGGVSWVTTFLKFVFDVFQKDAHLYA